MTHSADKQYTSHSTIIAEVTGVSGIYGMNISTVPDYRIPHFLSNISENKAATTLEQLYTGMANKSGVQVIVDNQSGTYSEAGNFPFFDLESTDYTDESNNGLFERFNYGVDFTVGDENETVRSVGFALPMYAAGFGYDTEGNLVPSNKAVPIKAITQFNSKVLINKEGHYLLSGNTISIVQSSGNYNVATTVIQIIDVDNFVVDIPYHGDLTYPRAGKYYGLNVDPPYPVSGESNPDGYTSTVAYKEDATAWKAGPVDLRWDKSRQLWCGSDFQKSDIIFGYLASDITPAAGRNKPSPFRMKTYKTTTQPTYIESFTDGGDGRTIVNILPNGLELINGDTFFINGTDTTYDGEQVLVSHSRDNTELYIDVEFDQDEADSMTSIGYVSVDIVTGDEIEVPRLVDKSYIVLNYDTHLSVTLNSKCVDGSGGCLVVEDDIFVVAVKKSPSDIRQIYVGYGE